MGIRTTGSEPHYPDQGIRGTLAQIRSITREASQGPQRVPSNGSDHPKVVDPKYQSKGPSNGDPNLEELLDMAQETREIRSSWIRSTRHLLIRSEMTDEALMQGVKLRITYLGYESEGEPGKSQ